MKALAAMPLSRTNRLPTALVCAGCGYRATGGELHLRCPNARRGDDVDHVIRRTLDPVRVEWPTGGEANPFVRYRSLFHWYNVARARGWHDEEVVADIERLDDAIGRVDGRGFRVTPFAFNSELRAWVKNETINVSGSHKARHLFGTLLALRYMGAEDDRAPLAIASCGNAALAAAVIARAADRELHVFVPAEADTHVVANLRDLGALVYVCKRGTDQPGDPSVLRLREAVAAGAVPFTCQGDENGVAIEGGLTLGYEIADQLGATAPAAPASAPAPRTTAVRLDNLFVQVGGGALASAAYQALAEARALGVMKVVPRLNTVQTAGVAPLARSFRLLRERLDEGRALNDVLHDAALHRSHYMEPWSPVRLSVASGILDDETYDWLAVARGMLATGGRVVLVDEPGLRDANRIAREATAIDVDATGSAGLAGLLALRHSQELSATESSAVLFTGVRRS